MVLSQYEVFLHQNFRIDVFWCEDFISDSVGNFWGVFGIQKLNFLKLESNIPKIPKLESKNYPKQKSDFFFEFSVKNNLYVEIFVK